MKSHALTQTLIAAALAAGPPTAAYAAYTPVYGGPTYDASANTGFRNPTVFHQPGTSAAGNIGAYSDSYYVNNSFISRGAFEVDNTGSVTTLGNLNTAPTGAYSSSVYAVNAGGAASGYSTLYDASGNSLGQRPVRWDAGNTTPVALDTLGVSSQGTTTGYAQAINSSGTTGGYSYSYTTANGVTTYNGQVPVLWAAGGTAITQLGTLGAASNGAVNGSVSSINTAGAAVGTSNKYGGTNGTTSLGSRPVRWDAGSTTATELTAASLGTDSTGSNSGYAYQINTGGTTIGYMTKYVNNTSVGSRAVRWDAGASAGTVLGTLNAPDTTVTSTIAYAINDAGTAVGVGSDFTSGSNAGLRAIRWDAGSTTAVRLGNLGDSSATSTAEAINNSGLIAGYVGSAAVVWNTDGTAINLNSLIDPSSGWVLTVAYGISDTGVVTGVGSYDPDGSGPLAAYTRAFVLQVPEPAGLAFFGIAVASLLRRRKASPGNGIVRSRLAEGCFTPIVFNDAERPFMAFSSRKAVCRVNSTQDSHY